MKGGHYAVLITISLTVLIGVMFHIQNSARMIDDISLDIGFVSFHLQQSAPLPHVLWATLGIGLIVGIMAGIFSTRGRVKKLERQLARAQTRGTGDGWG